MVLTTIGIVVGLSLAASLTRVIRHHLYAIDPLDAPTFAGVAIVMILTAGVAAYWPARLAAHADPMKALRAE
jgi:putative ABC transport system permease protein